MGLFDVLLVVATDVEADAVLAAGRINSGDAGVSTLVHREHRTYHDLGTIEGARVGMVQTEAGTGTAGGSLATVLTAIDEVEPTSVLMVGIAFGVSAKKQRIGQVLVSRQVQQYDVQRVGTAVNGTPVIIPRGDRATATPRLLNRLRAARAVTKADVRFGLLLSGEKLVDNIGFRDALVSTEPEALGGEMEGGGLYVAALERKVDWCIVKAVCDYADGKKGANKHARQRVAATNAVAFVVAALRQGGFEARRDVAAVGAARCRSVPESELADVSSGPAAIAAEVCGVSSPVGEAAAASAPVLGVDDTMSLPEWPRPRLVELADTLREVDMAEVTGRAEARMSVLVKADEQIHRLCGELYPTKGSTSDGYATETTHYPARTPLTFLPVPSTAEGLEQIAAWSALYSDFTLFVTEHKLHEFQRVYQSGSNSSGLPRGSERILALNKSQDEGLRRGTCLFLPRSSTSEWMTARELTTTTHYAPFHQELGEWTWLPVNSGPMTRPAIQDYLVYKTVVVPHIIGASLSTVIDIARNESDSFHRFNRFLRRAMRRLPQCSSERGVREVLDEMDSHVADLRLEGERLARLGVLSDARVAFVRLSLSVFASSDAAAVRAVAGINAVAEFARLLNGYADQTETELAMQKSDFYFPFLVQKRTEEPMFRTPDDGSGA